MLATGFVIYDANGLSTQLQTEAATVLTTGLEPSPTFLTTRRYATATWFEDALDIAPLDAETCLILLEKAVTGATEYRFWRTRHWQPRPKELLRTLSDLNAEFGDLVRQFHRAPRLGARIDLDRVIVERSVGQTGFFAWQSDVESLET